LGSLENKIIIVDDYQVITIGCLLPGISENDFTHAISDNLPLWVQLDTWIDDEMLDQIIRLD
jgi:hypothetical protein